MKVDETLSIAVHASGSAEVASLALTALRHWLRGVELGDDDKRALLDQAKLLDMLASTSGERRVASAQAMRSRGPRSVWSFRRLASRLPDTTGQGLSATLIEVADQLKLIAKADPYVELDRERVQSATDYVKKLLLCALNLQGAANTRPRPRRHFAGSAAPMLAR